jgi:hypothetical protein
LEVVDFAEALNTVPRGDEPGVCGARLATVGVDDRRVTSRRSYFEGRIRVALGLQTEQLILCARTRSLAASRSSRAFWHAPRWEDGPSWRLQADPVWPVIDPVVLCSVTARNHYLRVGPDTANYGQRSVKMLQGMAWAAQQKKEREQAEPGGSMTQAKVEQVIRDVITQRTLSELVVLFTTDKSILNRRAGKDALAAEIFDRLREEVADCPPGSENSIALAALVFAMDSIDVCIRCGSVPELLGEQNRNAPVSKERFK